MFTEEALVALSITAKEMLLDLVQESMRLKQEEDRLEAEEEALRRAAKEEREEGGEDEPQRMEDEETPAEAGGDDEQEREKPEEVEEVVGEEEKKPGAAPSASKPPAAAPRGPSVEERDGILILAKGHRLDPDVLRDAYENMRFEGRLPHIPPVSTPAGGGCLL